MSVLTIRELFSVECLRLGEKFNFQGQYHCFVAEGLVLLAQEPSPTLGLTVSISFNMFQALSDASGLLILDHV